MMPIYNGIMTFIDIPLCGGEQVSPYLIKHQRAEEIGQTHGSVDALSDDIKSSSLVFTSVLDPWSWYAAWYQRAAEHDMGLYGDDFKSALQQATHPWEFDHPKPGVFWDLPPVPKNFRGGIYSWVLFHQGGSPLMFGAMLDMHRLRQNIQMLVGQPIQDSEWPDHYPVPAEDLYDDEMLQWVAEVDGTVIGMMGYAPFKAAQRSIVWM